MIDFHAFRESAPGSRLKTLFTTVNECKLTPVMNVGSTDADDEDLLAMWCVLQLANVGQELQDLVACNGPVCSLV
jgi:hypothetical protein